MANEVAKTAGLTTQEARDRLARYGPNEVPEEPPHTLRDLARRFWGPVAWMLEAALAIELLLQKYPEAAIILALLVFNAVLAQVQERRARAALELLRHRLHVAARVLRDGAWTTVAARELVPGDRIHLGMGNIVPSDCKVVEGEVEVDQSTITGESEPVSRSAGTTLYSSSVIRRGEAPADVTATGSRTFYGKTAELVRSARTVSHLENLLFSIVRYLVTLDTSLAVLVLVVATLRGINLALVVPFVLILLIASVPAAMPATFTIANALESRYLVEQGVLVTGLTAVQEAASMDLLCVDKTGTLTEGRESLSEVAPWGKEDEGEVVALASTACDASTGDTVDLAILEEVKRRGLVAPVRSKFVPFDPANKRSEAVIAVGGQDRRIVLGSPGVVEDLCGAVPPGLEAAIERLSSGGGRVLAVASGTREPLDLVGLIALADPPRADAAELVRTLHGMGIRVVMLTGDTPPTARAVAEKVGIGTHIGERSDLSQDPSPFDGFAGVYPEDKFQLVHALQGQHHVVGMTGDGVNDAPALKQAEVGVAVLSATDVARASAKLVLTRPGLSDIVHAVQGGRRVYRRMLTWTLNKVSKNFEQVFLLTGGFVAAGIFVVSPFLILLMVFANDFVSMAAGTDNARISSAPDRWSVREIVVVAAVVGGCWLALSYTLLYWALDIAHLAIGPLQTFFFVYLVFGSQGTILLVRERDHAWASRPSTPLLIAIAGDILVISGLATLGILMSPIPVTYVLGLLLVIGAAALLVDTAKVAFIRWSGAFEPRSRLVRPPESRPLSR
jgi:H+-transporting ATPase